MRIQCLIVAHKIWMVKCSHRALELAKAIKHKKFNFNVFMALLGQGIDEHLLMSGLGYLGSLKLNESQAETT